MTERHGKTFKFILMKAMDSHSRSTTAEWEDLVSITNMTKNRMLSVSGFSPCQRVFGFNPHVPGGLLSGGDDSRTPSTMPNPKMGDLSVERSMKMRRAAAEAFMAADSSDALRRAIMTGPRPMSEYHVGEMVYFFRMGADKRLKFQPGYWQGPARIVMTDLPSTIWVTHQGYLIKASPERVRRASIEENMALTGWIEDIVKTKEDMVTKPVRGYTSTSMTNHHRHRRNWMSEENSARSMTTTRSTPHLSHQTIHPHLIYHLHIHQSRDTDRKHHNILDHLYPNQLRTTIPPPAPEAEPEEVDMEAVPNIENEETERPKRDNSSLQEDEPEIQPAKRTRLEYLEAYHTKIENLMKARTKKEVRMNELSGKNRQCFLKAIAKEIQNNIAILKDDLSRTGGSLRRVSGTNMITDPVTKRMNSEFLRRVCNTGQWSLTAQGNAKQRAEHDILLVMLPR